MDQHLDQISMNRNFSVHFLNFIPSLSVSRKLSEASQLRMNYSRRVQRPNADWLNPYTDITDPRNIRTGNPNLNPEFTHRLDLGYSNYQDVLGIGANLFSSYSNNAITNIRRIDEDGISYSSFDNVGREFSYGFETDISLKISDQFKLNSSGRIFKNEIVSVPAGIDSRRWSFSGNLNAFFHLPAGFRGSFYVNYEGPRAIAQGTRMGVRSEYSYGFETDISLKISDQFKLNSSGRIFKNEIVSVPAGIDSRRWSFSGNLNAFFHLPAGFRGSFYVNYEGPRAIAQGTRMGV